MSYMSTQFNPKQHSRYSPINKEKYKGKQYPIARSSWEWQFCVWCDKNDQIIAWVSEPIAIPYLDKGSGKQRRYFPDFLIKVRDKNDNNITWLVEVKPHKETLPPTKHGNKKKSTYLKEQKAWYTNISKWKAAEAFCKKKGWKFKIITEKHLYKK